MNAVAEAQSYIAEFLAWYGQSKSRGLAAAAEFFGLTPSAVKKIHYGEVKGIDADRLDRMRAIYAERRRRLQELKELSDENQKRINELIFRRIENRS